MKRINADWRRPEERYQRRGTMWCAIAFAIIALVSLPGAIATGNLVTIISWIAQTFLQLVLLSVIMVGQDLQARGTAQIITETHERRWPSSSSPSWTGGATPRSSPISKKIAQALHVELRKVPKAGDASAPDGGEADQPVAGDIARASSPQRGTSSCQRCPS